MLVETAVLRSTAPICSAIDMKRLPITSRRTGSERTTLAPRRTPRRPRRVTTRSTLLAHLRLEAGIEHEGAGVLEHERRPGHALARSRAPRARAALLARGRRRGTRRCAAARGACGDARVSPDGASVAALRARPSRGRAGAHARRHDLDGAPRPRVAEALAVRLREGAEPVAVRRLGHGERRLGTDVAQLEEALRPYERRGHALVRERRAALRLELREQRERARPVRLRTERCARARRRAGRPSCARRRRCRTRRAGPRADAAGSCGCRGARATAQTCWPAAPPKPTSANSRGSTPRRTDTSWIACAMRAFATSTKPAASSSALRGRPAAASSPASAASARSTGSRSAASGKRSGRTRPRNRFTSVSASSRARPRSAP